MIFSRIESRIFRKGAFRKFHDKNCNPKNSAIFVTTPIYYVNGDPHIGHLYTSVLADAIVRFRCLINPSKVVFTSGTDEHGLKVQQMATQNNCQPLHFCDSMSQKYLKMLKEFNISANQFTRTTSSNHRSAVLHFWELLKTNGYIYKQRYSGWYSVADESFIPDHDIVTNNMGERLTKSGNSLEWYEEENYMFKLSSFQDQLLSWISKSSPVIPEKFQRLTLNWLEKELNDISISRPKSRLFWGIDVPNDSSQIIYVWLDALVNYLTATGYPGPSSHWPPTCHVVGKDILKFHAIYWPAFLMAANMPLPNKIFCHSHWVVNHEKMSKSKGNSVDPFKESSLVTCDGLRYFLLKEGTAHSDANYSRTKLLNIVNSELANTLGNLLSRCTSPQLNKDQLYAKFDSKCISSDHHALSHIQRVCELPGQVYSAFDNYNFYRGMEHLCTALHSCSSYFQHSSPWLLKGPADTSKLNSVLHVTLETLRVAGIILQPIVPQLSSRLLDRLNIPSSSRKWSDLRPFYHFREQIDFHPHKLNNDQSPLFKRVNLEKAYLKSEASN